MTLLRRHYLLFLLCCDGSIAFLPKSAVSKSRSVQHAYSTLKRQQDVDPTTTTTTTTDESSSEEWLTKGFERDSSLRTNVVIGPKEILVYDTTLRDGTQGESISASCNDKLKIAKRLAAFGMDFIEAGWPGSNPKDVEFFARAKTELTPNERKKLVAFGSTRRKGIFATDDGQISALVDSDAPTICLVAKSHRWQVTDILRATPEENLDMIRDSVKYLVSLGRKVFVDLEHFFDGFKYDEEYALLCCEAAADAGAECLVLCDTNGGSMPWEVQEIVTRVVKHFDRFVTVGIHTHNDCGMAVANSVSGVRAGVGLVQGTINGIGERTGNADLCSIVPSLAFHVETKMECNENLSELTKLSRFVDEVLNRTPSHSAPFVGASAFAHKGGLHVAAMERSPQSYQHIDPTAVGNEKRVLISELSGRQNIMGKLKEAGVDSDDKANERALAILNRIKQLEKIGYSFEGAEASVSLMILHTSNHYCAPFRVLDYSAQVYDSNIDSATRVLNLDRVKRLESKDHDISHGSSNLGPTARATVKVRTIDEELSKLQPIGSPLLYKDRLEVSDGNGPVDALANALKRALVPTHPYLDCLELVDYKVRILDPESATAALTRVMIEFRDTEQGTSWSTVSVDRNVISASLNALVDGFEYALIEHAQSCMLCEDDL